MKLLRGILNPMELGAKSVMTIGNFDGVHRGHQALLGALRVKATQMRLPLLVLLFEPQPGEFFNKEKAPARLYALRDKLDALRACGVDYVYCLEFNQKLANMPAEKFADEIIFSRLNAHYVLLGQDFRFGRQRRGDVELLRERAKAYHAVVETHTDFCLNFERVSSTQVRHALYSGALDRARDLLGRPYCLSGRVIYGQGMGRKLGFPTANLRVRQGLLPLSGVYYVQVVRQGRPALFGVANLGKRPTVDGTKTVLEVHLFDINENLYGERLQVMFLHKLRDEIKFPSLDGLIAQIQADVMVARQIQQTENAS